MRKPVLAAAHSVIVMCGVLTGVSACVHSSAGQEPPIVICGTTVYGGGIEAVIYDVESGGTIGSSTYDTVIISVSNSCDKGSHVTWTPASAARLVQSAHTKDGLLAAVVLQPASQDAVFTVTATRDGKLVGTVTYQPPS